MPRISSIICTRNRAKRLPACLNSMEQAAVANRSVEIELLTLDNGSTDATELLQAWQKSTSVQCRGLLAAQRGLSHAKNYGLKRASGEIIIFTEDDCTVSPDHLAQLERVYDADAAPGLRGGRVLNNSELEAAQAGALADWESPVMTGDVTGSQLLAARDTETPWISVGACFNRTNLGIEQ